MGIMDKIKMGAQDNTEEMEMGVDELGIDEEMVDPEMGLDEMENPPMQEDAMVIALEDLGYTVLPPEENEGMENEEMDELGEEEDMEALLEE